MSSVVSYLIIAAIAAFVGFRWISLRRVCRKIPSYLREGPVVIDVRSPAEFSAGHFAGSRNVPLNLLQSEAEGLSKEKRILLCCASGARSGMAARILKSRGFHEVINVGSWQNLSTYSCQDN